VEHTVPLVLVVDDSPDARAIYGESLQHAGFRVETAEDGAEGVAIAKAEWPAVILMDLAMPNMDGWEAIRRLRADPLTADIPIIAISAHAFAGVGARADGHDANLAREAGADLCLSKPCLPSQVTKVVRAMLTRTVP
jgi:two-component system cell cycle response regulator DivK